MSFTNDKSFGRTQVQFLGGTILGQTIFASRSNSELLGPLPPKNQRVNAKKKKRVTNILIKINKSSITITHD